MTNLEVINTLRKSTFTDEDGEPYQLEFEPGLTDEEINKLRMDFPGEAIAPELIEILKMTRGWNGYGLEAVYFDSVGQFGFEELSKNSITLGHDGFGNFWVLDLAEDGSPDKVFYACHDPAVFVIHSQNLNEYLHHLLEFYQKPEDCHLNQVHEKTVITIWDNNEACIAKTDFLNNHPEYADFLSQFEGQDWTVADLRDEGNKTGFAWGRFGPNQLTMRHATELIWVIKNKKKSFFSRFFGR
ncbi:MAG: hypothetical protein Roseis2KO_40650 [Roseivirga sp.]